MTESEINEIVSLHGMWLRDEPGGVRADLRSADLCYADLRGTNLGGANLGGANLRNANLGGANLRNANLGGANLFNTGLGGANLFNTSLSGADLRRADLRRADLSYAILSGADLSYAILSGADLSGADLRWCVGDELIIHTIQSGKYIIVIGPDNVSIGCRVYTWSDWLMFSDEEIEQMDLGALEWWRVWKPILTAIMEAR